MTREEKLRAFVDGYTIEVPAAKVENELSYIMTQLRHGMQYEALSGGEFHLDPRGELEAQRPQLERLAYLEVKQELVLKDVAARQNFTVTRAELEAEAAAMAERQGCSVELIRSFFGEDLAMLERDVKRKKAEDWICEQI
ncbi:MAG: hypothetical protein IJE26_00180 [Oscillospiraceae bacterium]|nr:hypothetical protein [Oscillospiraceae bacterium]